MVEWVKDRLFTILNMGFVGWAFLCIAFGRKAEILAGFVRELCTYMRLMQRFMHNSGQHAATHLSLLEDGVACNCSAITCHINLLFGVIHEEQYRR
jgi:hypothetical protein